MENKLPIALLIAGILISCYGFIGIFLSQSFLDLVRSVIIMILGVPCGFVASIVIYGVFYD